MLGFCTLSLKFYHKLLIFFFFLVFVNVHAAPIRKEENLWFVLHQSANVIFEKCVIVLLSCSKLPSGPLSQSECKLESVHCPANFLALYPSILL